MPVLKGGRVPGRPSRRRPRGCDHACRVRPLVCFLSPVQPVKAGSFRTAADLCCFWGSEQRDPWDRGPLSPTRALLSPTPRPRPKPEPFPLALSAASVSSIYASGAREQKTGKGLFPCPPLCANPTPTARGAPAPAVRELGAVAPDGAQGWHEMWGDGHPSKSSAYCSPQDHQAGTVRRPAVQCRVTSAFRTWRVTSYRRHADD